MAMEGLPSAEVLTASRQLFSELRILFVELSASSPSATLSGQNDLLIRYAREYLAHMHLCAAELQKLLGAGGEDTVSEANTAEIRAEMRRVQWAACIWELALIMFLRRPGVLGEMLLLWWQRYWCDDKAETLLQEMLSDPSEQDVEQHPMFWPAIRMLISQGMPERALALLSTHSRLGDSMQDAASIGGDGSADAVLSQLQVLLESFPRLKDPALLEPQPEDAASMAEG
eukprot:6197509-Pleurochrysis_carterae.AAC.4